MDCEDAVNRDDHLHLRPTRLFPEAVMPAFVQCRTEGTNIGERHESARNSIDKQNLRILHLLHLSNVVLYMKRPRLMETGSFRANFQQSDCIGRFCGPCCRKIALTGFESP